MRVMWDNPAVKLKGADMTFGAATAPFRAGTSSSSAVVVLSFLCILLSNQDRLPASSIQKVCKLLGEAEWYVGTHGGANDQTTILRNSPNSVLYNRHSLPELDSTPLPFVRGVHVVLANSLWEVNKTLGGNQSFNMRKGWMQMGDEMMKLIIAAVRDAQSKGLASGDGWLSRLVSDRFGFTAGSELPLLESHPEYWEKIEKNYHKFGSLHEDILGIPEAAITELIMLLPVKITPEHAGRIFGKDRQTIERIYTRPRRRIGGYHIRTTARFFHRENEIGRLLERIFLEAERRVVVRGAFSRFSRIRSVSRAGGRDGRRTAGRPLLRFPSFQPSAGSAPYYRQTRAGLPGRKTYRRGQGRLRLHSRARGFLGGDVPLSGP